MSKRTLELNCVQDSIDTIEFTTSDRVNNVLIRLKSKGTYHNRLVELSENQLRQLNSFIEIELMRISEARYKKEALELRNEANKQEQKDEQKEPVILFWN